MRVFIALLGPLLWGTTYATVSAFFADWSPYALAAWRALPAGILLLLVKPSLPKISEVPTLLIIGFINITLFFSLLFASAMQLPSALVGVGMITLPVIGLVVVILVHKNQPSTIQILSAVILLFCSSYLFSSSKSDISVSSVLYLIAAMAVLIFGSIITKSAMKKVDWWKLLTWKLIFGGIMLLPFAYWQQYLSGSHYPDPFSLSFSQLAALIWLIIGVTSVSYGAYVYSIPRISTSELSFFGTLNPILAMVLGATVMGDDFSAVQISIMVVMISSNLAAQLYERRLNQRSEQTIISY
ncbi:DMT family transporter [Ferrimonas kyonanensis]|uniref:DMT family transporter n=1 Tax=Ferrimonas kyonanensis TaxID=364763 RepID=UPI000A039A29|nr:DMT family transporter [Ferrimonas kyonanensis]